MTKYAFIGDLHSDVAELEALLELVPTDYTLIFLGDLFDYRKPTGKGNSLDVYHLVRSIPNAKVVRSNHQQKLLSYLRGNPIQAYGGFQQTLVDFCLPGPKYHEELKDWLKAMPYALSLKCGDQEYRVAHGYYPDSLNLKNPTRTHKHQCIYGLPVLDPKREWWLHPHPYTYTKVCGHHHTVFTSNHSVILDGLCGTHEHGCLVAYLSDCKYLVSTRALHKVPNMNSAYYYPSEFGRPGNLNRLA
jgi:hypothetical protein